MKKFNTGIYQIVNLVNNKRYIGSAADLNKREKQHFWFLKKNYKKHKYLQNAYNKYGKENFVFEILLYCSKENLLFYEQRAIDTYDFENELYNIAPIAGNTSGIKLSEEHKKKIGLKHKGKIVSEKTKKKMKIARAKQIFSNEYKKTLSEAQKGEKSHMYGKYGKDHHSSKPIRQIDLITNKTIKIWENAREINKELNIHYSNISKACRGINKTSCGFKWEFVNKKNKE